MSQLVALESVSLAYGLHPLLDQVKLQINAGERICLIGRNGAGKSSLLKILEGVTLPDSGSVWRKPHLRAPGALRRLYASRRLRTTPLAGWAVKVISGCLPTLQSASTVT